MKNVVSSLLVFTLLMFAACSKPAPAMPVSVTFREASMQQSKVVQLHNNSGQPMKITLTFVGKDGATKQSNEILLPVSPPAPTEFGWMQGWAFLAGEKLIVRSAGFSDLEVPVP